MAFKRATAWQEEKIQLDSGLRWQVFVSTGQSDPDKPAILLVHGRFLNPKSTMALGRHLAAIGHCVVLPVLEGHRKSEGTGKSSPHNLRQNLNELLQKKNIDPRHAVGITHSEGILIILKGMKHVIALNPYFDEKQLPEPTRAMIGILTEKQPDGTEPTALQIQKRLGRLFPHIHQALVKTGLRQKVSLPDYPEAFRTYLRALNPKLAQTLRNRSVAFQGAKAENIEAPLLVLATNDDFFVGRQRLKDTKIASSNVSLTRFSGNSHWVHIAHKKAVYEQIQNLLDEFDSK